MCSGFLIYITKLWIFIKIAKGFSLSIFHNVIIIIIDYNLLCKTKLKYVALLSNILGCEQIGNINLSPYVPI